MKDFKNLLYILSGLSFSVVIGAAFYEHLAVFPRAFAAPPASLTMVQGEYGLNAVAFWTKIHPITLLLSITSLVMFWKSDRRKNILIYLVGYVAVLIVTGIYFVPELMAISTTEFSANVDADLQARGAKWLMLSWLRLFFIIALAVMLFFGLTKDSTRSTSDL
jgi:hypothetical protein